MLVVPELVLIRVVPELVPVLVVPELVRPGLPVLGTAVLVTVVPMVVPEINRAMLTVHPLGCETRYNHCGTCL